MKDNVSPFDSDEYDRQIKRTLPYYEEFYKQVADVLRTYNPDPLTWLDVGCGTGKMAEIAFEQAQIKEFVFCDSSVRMIEHVRNHFSFPNTKFLVSAVQDLKFEDRFDIITAIQVNHYLQNEERKAAVQKCYKALKTGGLFISFENFAPFSESGKQLYLDRWKTYQIGQGKDIAESEKHISRYNKDYFPITLSEHLKVMKECGFKAAEILWLSYMQVGLLGIK